MEGVIRALNEDGELGIYDRGDCLRVVNHDDGSSLDFPRSLARTLAYSLISVVAEPSPPYEPQRRVVHQTPRITRSLSEGYQKLGG